MKYVPFFLLLLAGCIAVRPTERIEFDWPDLYPEGVAYDSTRDLYYVSSQRNASIGKVDRSGNYSVLHADSTLKSSYGMKVHPDGKRLFVCVGDANYSKFTAANTRKKMIRLIVIDLSTGNRVQDIDLSGLVPGKHFANDLTFDNNGNVYITDSYANVIYKVDQAGKAAVFARHKMFETEGYGLNGIVYHQSGYLLVANSNTGRIYKVNMANPSQVERVNIEQYFLGADGILLNSANKLTVVANGGNDKVFQLESDDDWRSAKLTGTTLAADRFTYPATAALKGEEVWVLNAKTNELIDSNAVPARKFAIQKAVFKPVPVK